MMLLLVFASSHVNLEDLERDIKTVMYRYDERWPADYGTYGPLFVRLAWHAAGTYRVFDGRGGADGGRQRFSPESDWIDNTNLDKARLLLVPIKKKYGRHLSWGDLIVLSGTVALKESGAKVLGFCGGRIDDDDGYESELLSTSLDRPCEKRGECDVDPKFASTTQGLIYVNPEGPQGVPDPVGSATEIRRTFQRMDMNDMETVSLIGGGHALGKAHGTCPMLARSSCSRGKGKHAFTSGFEGSWTDSPTRWSNRYFQILRTHNWTMHQTRWGKTQWRVEGANPIFATDAHNSSAIAPTMMLTSDVALLHDSSFRKYVDMFAESPRLFDDVFAKAWYKLTTRDMGPIERCTGDATPPLQDWQHSLKSPKTPGNAAKVLQAFRHDFQQDKSLACVWIQLAWTSCSSYRKSDHTGGCNGAFFLLDTNAHNKMTTLIKKKQQVCKCSVSDLVLLGARAGFEFYGVSATHAEFCFGRTDSSKPLNRPYAVRTLEFDTFGELREASDLLGISTRELFAVDVILSSILRSCPESSNEMWTIIDARLDDIMNNRNTSNAYESDPDIIEMAMSTDRDGMRAYFTRAWDHLEIADRYDGPNANHCILTDIPRQLESVLLIAFLLICVVALQTVSAIAVWKRSKEYKFVSPTDN